MSNIKIAGFQSNLFEELNDADLMAVVGGGGTDIVGGLASNLTGTVAGAGNAGTPTSTLVGEVIGGTVTTTGNTLGGYITNNGAVFTEQLLQGTNGTLVDLGNSV